MKQESSLGSPLLCRLVISFLHLTSDDPQRLNQSTYSTGLFPTPVETNPVNVENQTEFVIFIIIFYHYLVKEESKVNNACVTIYFVAICNCYHEEANF